MDVPDDKILQQLKLFLQSCKKCHSKEVVIFLKEKKMLTPPSLIDIFIYWGRRKV